MIRKIEYGDHDLIITFFTQDHGKIAVIAKSAKKSVKRFSGTLELFSITDIVCKTGRGKLPILQEATLKEPFLEIRKDIRKTAYASYWAELINLWVEEKRRMRSLFRLFEHALTTLDTDRVSPGEISTLFQLRFLDLAGMFPDLNSCTFCRLPLSEIKGQKIMFDLAKGGLVCEKCKEASSGVLFLSKGTIKQLQWLAGGDLKRAERIRFSRSSLSESISFLEDFVPYHLGKNPKSLAFLKRIRAGY